MKKIIYAGCALAAALMMWSCSDFLDTQSYTMKDTSNFPKNSTDAQTALAGVYSSLYSTWLSLPTSDPNYLSDDSNWQATPLLVANISSDDALGGGGPDDAKLQAINRLETTNPDLYLDFWKLRYRGIYRANSLLETIDNVTEWDNDTQKDQITGEVYFLRALYYFELSETFGDVPLIVSSVAENIPRTPAEQVYAQIAADLQQAINLMPATPVTGCNGHATKWAAEALMARVFLFYTGYYQQDALPLAASEEGAEAGTIDKDQVITWLDDCINNSGHGLLGDFRDLWPYTNEYTVSHYGYTTDPSTWDMDPVDSDVSEMRTSTPATGIDGAPLAWAGDGNKEEVFAIKFNTFADYDDTSASGHQTGDSNQIVLFFGLRPGLFEDYFPFGWGWGAGPINPALNSDWQAAEPNDLRRQATIVNEHSELNNYTAAPDQMEETGLWQKKYVPVSAYDQDGTFTDSYTYLTQGNFMTPDYQTYNTQDICLIRFADVLLMDSELKGDATGMNEVRARVGLPPVAYSLQALKNERRWELAFEGQRWFDLMRWGDAATALDSQAGLSITNQGVAQTSKTGLSQRYNDTHGLKPIPQSQIDLSGGVLTQNPGWGTAGANFTTW